MRIHSLLTYTIALLAVLTVTSVQAADYLPWKKGDSASFTNQFNDNITLSPQAGPGRWQTYTNFADFGPLSIWTKNHDERIYLYQNNKHSVQLFTDFSAPVGFSTKVRLEPCNHSRVFIAEKNLSLTTPAGNFNNVIRLDLSPSCADGGTVTAWFAHGVGLIQWEQNSITGPVVYRLQHASIGGVQYPKQPETPGVSLSLFFPQTVKWLNGMPGPMKQDARSVEVAMVIHNHTRDELRYEFNTSQRFDIIVNDASGRQVASWSRDKSFITVLGTMTIPPGGSQRLGGSVELCDDEGKTLSEGSYTLRIEMSSQGTLGSNHPANTLPLGAAAPLEIRWAR